ncbi:MAG TPA: hypothetical protein PLQ77_00205 [Smithellaceae bacterium]|nr:hypothetical protein [Smithellaceae bacterium]MDD3257989.1 hypothetical protein [Smithellaceae bacterium]HOG11380.1 hypothetical protein [Smithellaceae bacterium]HPL09131.1 hypothetical protein [Smithellaceae bacterium]
MKFCILIFILCLLAMPGLCKAASEEDVYDAMFNADASLFTTGYGVFLDQVKDGQRFGASIDVFNKAAGFAATYSSVTTKAFATGDVSGAGEEAMLAVLSEIAGWPSGQGLLKYVGLSTGVFQVALTAYSITKESFAQVRATKIALNIETLYGWIESDPVLKPKKGRQLGDKSDPIPVNNESVEYMFRKVAQDERWRNLFKSYVSEELGETFPEPSTWDWLSIAAVDGWKSAHTAEQAEIFKDKRQVETWIAGLLSQLNKYARAVESEVILRQTLAKIEKASKKITPEFQKFVVGAEEAEKKLPEIDAYAKQVPTIIAAAKKNQNWDSLYDVRDKIGYYARVYVRVLPDTGNIGKKKQATKAALKNSWVDVSKTLKDIPKTIKEDFTAQTVTPQYKTSISLAEVSPDFIDIDEVAARLHKAKSLQDMEAEVILVKEDTEKKYRTFQENHNKENPAGDQHPAYNSRRDAMLQTLENQRKALEAQIASCDQYCRWLSGANPCGADGGKTWERCFNSASDAKRAWEKTAWKPLEDLETDKKNYNAKRELYAGNIFNQHEALLKAIGRLTNEERARFADMEKLKKDALDTLGAVDQSVPIFYPETETKHSQVTAADTKQYLNSFRGQKTDGYLGLPKMKFPKWGEDGMAVYEYVRRIERNVSNERQNFDRLSEKHSQAIQYIGKLKTYLKEKDRYEQEIKEAKERIYALQLQSDPKAQVIPDIEKRIAEMKNVEKLALEIEAELNNNLIAENQKQLAGIEDDLQYLDYLFKRIDYWRDAVRGNTLAGSVNATVVEVAVATENSAGSNHHKYLAPSWQDLSLFDKAKAAAAANALLKDVERTGIAKWDPNGDTGLKVMLEKKAAEIRNYCIDTPDYAIVNANVVYAARIARMAADVKAIPASTYGTNTYKEGLKNRTFDEKLGAALGNGTAFAMNIEMKMNSNEQTVSVTLDKAKELAASHGNATIKTASSDMVKAIEEHLSRYNAQVAQEAKQWEIDKAKAEAEQKLQNECLAKGGNYSNGECKTIPGGTGLGTGGFPGQSGQAAGPGAIAAGGPAGINTGAPPAGRGAVMPQPPGSGAKAPAFRPDQTGPAKGEPVGFSASAASRNMGGRSGMDDNLKDKVKDLYGRFKEAYEAKNASGVIYCLSDQWESSDGGTLSDLQQNLRRTFRTFDQIQFRIENMQISNIAEDRFRVSYDAVITSRIYKRNLKHEEKSSVQEEVTIGSSGKPKISKTLGGRFWYVK